MWMECEPVDGPIAMVSQSGAMSAMPIGLLFEQGLGVRYSLATGNDADVNVLEMATAAASDPDDQAAAPLSRKHPAGRSSSKRWPRRRTRAASTSSRSNPGAPKPASALRSRTPGALANEDRVVDAALERVGIWRARNIGGLVSAAQIYLKGWKPKGRRLVTISGSGATGVMSADEATFAGLEMVRLEGPVRKKLDAILPTFASAGNPIDLTAALLSNNRLLSDILPVLAHAERRRQFHDRLPDRGTRLRYAHIRPGYRSFRRGDRTPGRCLGWQRSHRRPVQSRGRADVSARGRGDLSARAPHRSRRAHRPRKARPADRNGRDPAAPSAKAACLTRPTASPVLAQAGLRVVPHHLCRTAAQAATAWRNLGGPVAVKGCSADLPHKSEHGLVRLGLDNADAVQAAFRDMERRHREGRRRIRRRHRRAHGRGTRELMIGAHRDPMFGPVVALGDGGKYVEAMPDVRLLLPPFTTDDALTALKSLRCWSVLAGTRGEPPADVAAVAEATRAVGDLVTRASPRILSLDINPLIVDAGGYAIVDAVVVVEEDETGG